MLKSNIDDDWQQFQQFTLSCAAVYGTVVTGGLAGCGCPVVTPEIVSVRGRGMKID